MMKLCLINNLKLYKKIILLSNASTVQNVRHDIGLEPTDPRTGAQATLMLTGTLATVPHQPPNSFPR